MVPAPFLVVLDANALFPATLRDTLLRAADAGYYQLRWTGEILDEMERNLVAVLNMAPEKASRLRRVMETYFPEAGVRGYGARDLYGGLSARDLQRGDQHVELLGAQLAAHAGSAGVPVRERHRQREQRVGLGKRRRDCSVSFLSG